MAPGDYKMIWDYSTNSTSACTTDIEYYSFSNYYDNFNEEEIICINDKSKYKMQKQIGNIAKPKMKKKQYSRLTYRRG